MILLKIHNFKLFSDINIELPSSGLMLLRGVREDGGNNYVGKSSLCEAIWYVMSGWNKFKTIGELVRRHPQKYDDMSVMLSYDGISIIRGKQKDGTILKCMVNGEAQGGNRQPDIKEFIKSITGITTNVVDNILYMSQEYGNDLIASTDKGIKSLLYYLLQLDSWEQYNGDTKHKLKEIKLLLSDVEYKLKQLPSDDVYCVSAEHIDRLKKKLDNFNRYAERYSVKCSGVTLPMIRAQINKLREVECARYELEILRNTETYDPTLISALMNYQNDMICPVCGSNVNMLRLIIEKLSSDNADIIMDRINRLQTIIASGSRVNTCDILDDFAEHRYKLAKRCSSILMSKIQQFAHDRGIAESLEEQRVTLLQEKERYNKDIIIYNNLTKIFGSNGIQLSIFNKYKQFIEVAVNDILNRIEFPFVFKINTDKQFTSGKTSKGITFSFIKRSTNIEYHISALSYSQKVWISFALRIAMLSIFYKRYPKAPRIAAIDEGLGAMDIIYRDKFVDMLRYCVDRYNIGLLILITHSDVGVLKNNFDHVLTLNSINGVVGDYYMETL